MTAEEAAKRIATLQHMGVERGLELRQHKIEEILAEFASQVTASLQSRLDNLWSAHNHLEKQVASLTKERDQLQQKLEAFTDWDEEPDALLGELKYIASSPAPEHGGFHERVTAAARGSVAKITSLRARVESLTQAIQWALGEEGDFRARKKGEGAYWWRKELRVRAFGCVIARKALQEGNNG